MTSYDVVCRQPCDVAASEIPIAESFRDELVNGGVTRTAASRIPSVEGGTATVTLIPPKYSIGWYLRAELSAAAKRCVR